MMLLNSPRRSKKRSQVASRRSHLSQGRKVQRGRKDRQGHQGQLEGQDRQGRKGHQPLLPTSVDAE